MIEMLGVLAIIGVLSVGGIAGYSKAMRMYNSNLQKNQLRELFAGMLQIQSNLNFKDNFTSITNVFDALNIIPQGLTYKYGYLYDKFGNTIRISAGYSQPNNHSYYGFTIFMPLAHNKLTQEAEDYCLNTFLIAKENINHISAIQRASDKNPLLIFQETLKTYTLQQIHQFCKLPDGATRYELHVDLVL